VQLLEALMLFVFVVFNDGGGHVIRKVVRPGNKRLVPVSHLVELYRANVRGDQHAGHGLDQLVDYRVLLVRDLEHPHRPLGVRVDQVDDCSQRAGRALLEFHRLHLRWEQFIELERSELLPERLDRRVDHRRLSVRSHSH